MTARRILIVSNLFPPHVVGGAEVVAWRQARELVERGHHVAVFAGWIAPPGQEFRLGVEETDGLRIWRVPVVSFDPGDNFHVPSVARRLQAVLEAEAPELVHFHNVAGLGFSLIPLAKQRGIPVVVTLHDHAGYCFKATALRPDNTLCTEPEECASACSGAIVPRDVGISLPMRLRRDYIAWTLAQADRLISPSASLAAATRIGSGVSARHVQVISNGIDLAPFRLADRATSGAPVRFLCVAYLSEHKGTPDLLDAAARLAAQPELDGRWSLTLAGDGHLRSQVEADLATGRLGDAVTLLGRVPRERIITEMSLADVVVLPSRWPENEPVVLLEAIAAGVAQLATSVGGMPALIEQDVTGDLVPPCDPGALADAMARYIREPGLARRQGRRNWERRHLFSEEASLHALERAYEQVSRGSSHPQPERPLVICAGDWPLPHVAEICNNLYRLEEPCPGVRLVWHSWLPAEEWERAVLLWNWSPGASREVMSRAFRSGVPALAPDTCTWARAAHSSFGSAVLYGTFLEALVMLARLPYDGAALRVLRRHCREAAEYFAAGAPGDQYQLRLSPLTA